MKTAPNQQQLPPDGQLDRAMDPEYAAISTTAVLGLIFSALGVLAIIVPPMAALSALGLVLGFTALRKIRRSEGSLTGRGIALAAFAAGAIVLVGSTAYQLQTWLSQRRTLEGLSARSYEITDDVLAGRYEKVYNLIPEDFRRQQGAGPQDFRGSLAPALAGAGSVVRRTLMSLEIIRTDDGAIVAPARMFVELEQRYLELQIVFKESPGGGWDLIGVGAGETFESKAKFAPDEPEPKEPADGLPPANSPPPPAAPAAKP
jgi:hypothetical protein